MAMYNSKFVTSVKVGGKVLREFGDQVFIPFGAEYSLFLKNLNTRRAKVKISIDGEDVLGGTSLVVNANSVLDLERYVQDNDKGNRFKFIERTSNIEQYRGIKAEDGLIRIEFAFEKQYPVFNSMPYYPPGVRSPTQWDNSALRGTVTCNAVYGATSASIGATSMNVSAQAAVNDVGITVPGSISDQKFQTIMDFATDPGEVIVLKLMGEVGQQKVSAPVTVKAKPKCVTCGKVNKAISKFCSECGTALTIIDAKLPLKEAAFR
jgi:hypothetical protein